MPNRNQEYSLETQRRAKITLEIRRRAALAQYTKPIWKPISEVQAAAIASPADELYYGGAAGGGKTDLLIGLAITYHYRSIIFRREFPQLKAIISRTKEIVNQSLVKPVPKYNQTEHVWRNLPGSKELEFGAMKNETDKEKYQGRPHDLKGWDEIAHFTESQFVYANAWNRSTKEGQRSRVVATGNPPMTPEGQWVLKYWGPWLDKAHPLFPYPPGDLLWYATIDGESQLVDSDTPIWSNGIKLFPRSRTFIPAALSDNPILSETNYASVLQSLPEPMRTQLLFGDFTILPNSDAWQVIPTEWVLAAQERWKQQGGRQTPLTAIGLDPSHGGNDRTVITLRYANYIDEQIVHAGSATPDGFAAARHVLRAIGLNPDALQAGQYEYSRAAKIPINTDAIGVGASAHDALAWIGLTSYPVHFGQNIKDTDRTGVLTMLNMRALAYWTAREMLDPVTGIGLCIPPDHDLLMELTTPRFAPTIHGIQVEDKVEVAKRLGRSPDKADSLVLSLLDMVSRTDVQIPTSTSHKEYGQFATGSQPPQQRKVVQDYDDADAYNQQTYYVASDLIEHVGSTYGQGLSPEELYELMEQEQHAQSYTEHARHQFQRKRRTR